MSQSSWLCPQVPAEACTVCVDLRSRQVRDPSLQSTHVLLSEDLRSWVQSFMRELNVCIIWFISDFSRGHFALAAVLLSQLWRRLGDTHIDSVVVEPLHRSLTSPYVSSSSFPHTILGGVDTDVAPTLLSWSQRTKLSHCAVRLFPFIMLSEFLIQRVVGL